MEIKLIYSTEGLGHQRRCEILKQKFEYLGFETSIEPIKSKAPKPSDILIFDSTGQYREIKTKDTNSRIYNIGLIDFKPCILNNYKPSIDYCVLHPDIFEHQNIIDPPQPTIFTYGFNSDDYLLSSVRCAYFSPDHRDVSHEKLIIEMKKSSMAIVKAGLMAYETIACGIPTYVFGTDYYEWHRAIELQNRGLAKIWNPKKETELPCSNDKDSWIRLFKQTRLKDGSDMIIKNLLGELL